MNNLLRALIKDMRPASLLLAVVMIIGVTSCRSHKDGVSSSASDTVTQRSVQGNFESRFVGSMDSDTAWEAVRLPVTLRLEAPASFSVSGTATLIRDSSILLSFRMFGLEVAQIYITGEEVTVIDKFHKKYFTQSPSELLKGFDPSIGNLQSIFLGQPFVFGERADVKYSDEGDGTWIASVASGYDIDYGFIFDSSDYLVAFTAYSEALNSRVACTYAAPVAHGQALFSPSARFTMSIGNDKEARATLDWNFDKARWDGDVDRRGAKVPSGYQFLTMEEMLKMFGK